MAAEHRANPVSARFYGPIRFGISPCSTPRPAVFSDKADKARPPPSIPRGLYFMIMFPISSLVVLSDKNSEREGEAMVLSDIIMVRGLEEADSSLYAINQYTSQPSL